jgi:hypothetical protein
MNYAPDSNKAEANFINFPNSSSHNESIQQQQQQQDNNNKLTTSTVYSELVVAIPRKISNLDERWSLPHLEDQLIIDLCSARTAKVIYDPIVKHYPQLKNNKECQHIIFEERYREQAEKFMHRMPIYKDNPPEFLIYVSDLSPRVSEELQKLSATNFDDYKKIVSNAIDRICEATNYEYFLRSAKGYPKKFRFIVENKKEG